MVNKISDTPLYLINLKKMDNNKTTEDVWTLKQQLHDALIDVDTLKMQKSRLEKELYREKECYYATVRSYDESIHKYHSDVIRHLDQDINKIKHLLKGCTNWQDEVLVDARGLEIQLTDIIKTTMTKTILDYEKALR
tara:strand:+ start:20640 stop:21050 length:411 start_codon:yes stop_codon:yes gene_type:complete